MSSCASSRITLASLALLLASGAGQAEDAGSVGSVTKLPIPRFVSLKPSDTPMREGPSKDHRIKWVFKREGLPVEVIAEHEQWRRIRDSESTDGWVFHARLSNRRTVVVRPPKDPKANGEQRLFKEENENAAVVAKVQPGVVANIERCSKEWCKVAVEGYSGFIRKALVWGVYPDEVIK